MERLLAATFRAEQTHFWFRGLRRFARPLLSRAVAGRAAPRLLDAGCGTGGNLALLSSFGTTTAFDLTPLGLQLAHRRGHRRLARATITAIPFPDAAFDVVTCFDVVYALERAEARRALAEICRVLKPGGGLVMNVAAMRILRGGHEVFAQGVFRYDRPGLRSDLQQVGFAIETITYTNASLFPFVLAARLLQRLAGRSTPEETTTEIQVPPAPVNAVLDALLAVEACAMRLVDMPFGSSLLCLARKPDRTTGRTPETSTDGAAGTT